MHNCTIRIVSRLPATSIVLIPSTIPIVSIVVPFFGYPFLWLVPYNRDFGQPKKGTTMETLGRAEG